MNLVKNQEFMGQLGENQPISILLQWFKFFFYFLPFMEEHILICINSFMNYKSYSKSSGRQFLHKIFWKYSYIMTKQILKSIKPKQFVIKFTKQSNCHICGGKQTWTIAQFSTNRLLKREVGRWQKRSCVMDVICWLLQTIMPQPAVTKEYVKFVTKSIWQVYMGLYQREKAEITV